jgi:hypothetical protein
MKYKALDYVITGSGDYACFRCIDGDDENRRQLPTMCREAKNRGLCMPRKKYGANLRKPSKYFARLFDEFVERIDAEVLCMYREYREETGTKLWYLHDFIHAGAKIFRAVRDYENDGGMRGYYNPDDGKWVCALCAIKKYRKNACVQHDRGAFQQKDYSDRICWREVNLLGKKAWKGIPKRHYRMFSNPKKDVFAVKHDVDTLNYRRKELEAICP